MNWTPDQVMKFETLFHQGLSFAQIARQMGEGLTRAAAIGKAYRLGLSRSEAGKAGPAARGPLAKPRATATSSIWTPERVQLATSLWLDAQADPVIVEALGGLFTARAIRARMHRDGIDRPARTRLPRTAPNPNAGPSASFERGSPADARPPQLHLVRRAEAAPADPASLKTLAERGLNECCWPVGAADPVRGQLFCAAPTAFRKSYCPAHSPAQASALKSVRWKEETRIARAETPLECDIDLVEQFA